MYILKQEILRKGIYDGQKDNRIKNYKALLSSCAENDFKSQYKYCSLLFEEYKSFQFDSAYVYTQKLLHISELSHNISDISESRLRLGFILLSSGMFKETFDYIKLVNPKLLDNALKLKYYELKYQAYSTLATYNNNNFFSAFDRKEAFKYLDSTINLTKPNSYEHILHMGDLPDTASAKRLRSYQYYEILLNQHKLTLHQKAVIATGLSNFYQGNKRLELLMIGAICDIRSSTKETMAAYLLGMELHKAGQANDAYVFLQEAMNNAQFYGSKTHKVEIASILPFIASQKIMLAEQEHSRFVKYFAGILTALVIVALISFIVFVQLKRLRIKDQIIGDKNERLNQINNQLSEEAKIKEQYIGQFFDMIADHIAKIEKLKRNLEKKLKAKRSDEAIILLDEIDIKKERESLFASFDHIFMKLFPNFITDFNALLKSDEQLWPKHNEILTTNLRIYALMRLGINDPEKVARILQCSVSTVYTYKFRIKNKALVASEEFDRQIMKIQVVNS